MKWAQHERLIVAIHAVLGRLSMTVIFTNYWTVSKRSLFCEERSLNEMSQTAIRKTILKFFPSMKSLATPQRKINKKV